VFAKDATYAHCGLPWLKSFAALDATKYEVKIYRDTACKDVIKVP
jgi:hypothetical protein